MKKIILFGKNGFIGKNLYEQFLIDFDVLAPSHLEIDLLDESAVASFLKSKSADIVINATDIPLTTEGHFEKRVRMYKNVAKYNEYYDKMIFFGSGAEYGRTLPVQDIKEEQFDRIIPEDSYGFCLHQMTEHARNSNNIYNLRLFGIFGKYELWNQRFISNAICKALFGFPITLRQDIFFDYLHVDDLCKMVRWVIEGTPVYHDYNAVSGRKYSLYELAVMINHLTGEKKVPIYIAHEGIGKEYTASNERIKREMESFEAEPMEQSITKLIDYYRIHMNEIVKEKLLYNS